MVNSEHHKAVNLYDEQITVYENARNAVLESTDESMTEGEIIRELAEAYTGWSP
jgi:hypothetical protein